MARSSRPRKRASAARGRSAYVAWERGYCRRLHGPIRGETLLRLPVWRMTRTPARLRPRGYYDDHVYRVHLGLRALRCAEPRSEGVP